MHQYNYAQSTVYGSLKYKTNFSIYINAKLLQSYIIKSDNYVNETEKQHAYIIFVITSLIFINLLCV